MFLASRNVVGSSASQAKLASLGSAPHGTTVLISRDEFVVPFIIVLPDTFNAPTYITTAVEFTLYRHIIPHFESWPRTHSRESLAVY